MASRMNIAERIGALEIGAAPVAGDAALEAAGTQQVRVVPSQMGPCVPPTTRGLPGCHIDRDA